jgi:hypothetical protein
VQVAAFHPRHSAVAGVDEGRRPGHDGLHPAAPWRHHLEVVLGVAGEHPRRQHRDRGGLIGEGPAGVGAPVGEADLDQLVELRLGALVVGVDEPDAVVDQRRQHGQGAAERS